MKPDIILIRYGELSLKSAYVRNQFEFRLLKNIELACTKHNVGCSCSRERGRLYCTPSDFSTADRILRHTFGVTSFSHAVTTTANVQDIESCVQEFAKTHITSKASFALRVTRTGAIHPYTSQGLAVQLGQSIVDITGAPVDLEKPEVELYIEIRGKKAYAYTEKIPGVGGLPLGTQGRVATLVTSPFSLIASWYIMKRGCSMLFILPSSENEQTMQRFCLLWMNKDSPPVQINSADEYQEINTILTKHHCEALITDHYLEGASNSVLKSLSELKKSITVPVLHPLIGIGSQELHEVGKRIGVFT